MNDLADALGLTDNAIRAHLAAMQADGLVESAGERVGKRKPRGCPSIIHISRLEFPWRADSTGRNWRASPSR